MGNAYSPSVTQSDVPLIYSPRFPSPGISIWGRLLALSIGLLSLSVLITAAKLQPAKEGTGTHTEMGMAQCQWMARTGIPCPSCGMTTSFSWFVRGNIVASFYVQPMGMLLALATAMTVWVGLYIGITGRAVHRALRGHAPGMSWVIGLMVLWVLAWGWKIWIHVRGIDGW